MDAIAVWFSSLSKSGKTTAVLVYVMVFMSVSTVIAVEYQQDQVANIPVHEIASLSYSQETLSAVTEQKRILMVFDEEVPFKTKKIEDPTLPKGQSYVQTPGVKGSRDVTYEITYNDGKETGRAVLKEKILIKPVAEVKVIGTYEAVQKPQVQGVQTGTSEEVSATTGYTLFQESEEYYCPPTKKSYMYNQHRSIGTFDTQDECYGAAEEISSP